MREKIGALIKFLCVIAGFIMIFWGVCGAYGTYFGADDIAGTVTRLIVAAIGAGVAFGGMVLGNIVNR